MTPIVDKQARLVNALVKANEQRKLTWQPYEDEEGCAYTEIGDKTIYLSKVNQGGTDSIKLEIYAKGRLAETFLDDNLLSSDVIPTTNENWFQTMTALLEEANRLASGSDEVLDSLLDDLEE